MTLAYITTPPTRREQWRFRGREKHWGYTYLIWVLVANPSPRNGLGKRHVKFVG